MKPGSVNLFLPLTCFHFLSLFLFFSRWFYFAHANVVRVWPPVFPDDDQTCRARSFIFSAGVSVSMCVCLCVHAGKTLSSAGLIWFMRRPPGYYSFSFIYHTKGKGYTGLFIDWQIYIQILNHNWISWRAESSQKIKCYDLSTCFSIVIRETGVIQMRCRYYLTIACQTRNQTRQIYRLPLWYSRRYIIESSVIFAFL